MSILIPPAGPGRASRAPLALPRLPSPRQILTQEDWNVVLYNGMASTSSWAALYFVALMTFGNYVLFNLLVAILVEGFQAEVTPCPQQSAPGRNRPPGWSWDILEGSVGCSLQTMWGGDRRGGLEAGGSGSQAAPQC